MQALKATPPRLVADPTVDVSNTLHGATHVFIRHDATRKPLQPPYDGPYRVLDRSTNFYTVDIKGRQDTVAISRLKPAYLDTAALDSAPPTQPSTILHPHPSLSPRPLHLAMICPLFQCEQHALVDACTGRHTWKTTSLGSPSLGGESCGGL